MSINNTNNAVLIFDWDDTICPSSFVDQYNIEHFEELPLHFKNLFNEVGRAAKKCLETAAKYGEVIIITNSDDGWVRFSAERFVPNLLPVIGKYRIVSARTRYERFYPNQPLCWKAAAFAHEVNEIYDEQETPLSSPHRVKITGKPRKQTTAEHNDSMESLESTDVSSESSFEDDDSSDKQLRREIISFGDSMEERTAVRIVSGQLSAIPKSVMFISSPSPLQIIGQLNMVTSHMKFVCEHNSSLDLEISPHQAQRCAETYMERNKILADHFERVPSRIRVAKSD